MSTSRESTFRELRPRCVKLNQLVTPARAGGKIDAKELNAVLGELYDLLQHAGELDDALCDYVLFPLLPLFRLGQSLPSSVSAKVLQCLRILLDNGRGSLNQPELISQLLILLMNLLQKQNARLSAREANEPEVLALCRCMKSLLSLEKLSFPDSSSKNIDPQLVITGNILADLLDVASSDPVASARLPALQCIESLLHHEIRLDNLKRFLPGILSKLTRPMFTTAIKGTSYKSLVACLRVIQSILPRVIGAKSKAKDGVAQSEGETAQDEWVQKNVGHVKAALSNVVKLKEHDKPEVRQALLILCGELLQKQPISPEITKLLVETVILISGREMAPKSEMMAVSWLKSDGMLRDEFFQVASSILQNLPTSLQSTDQTKREEAVTKAKACIYLASTLPIGLEDIGETAVESLFDCVRSFEASSKLQKIIESPSSSELALELTAGANVDEIFQMSSGLKDTVQSIKELITGIMTTRFATSLLDSLTDASHFGYSQTGLSKLWILSSCLSGQGSEVGSQKPNETVLAFKETALSSAYDGALALMDKAPLTSDWRVQALSLNMIGTYAERVGPEFRSELSFALYPIVERLACQDERLRRHASQTLQRVAKACGYRNLQDILLQNADYLVNSVSIKLTDLEPRPEVAHVLQAAIRIGGAPMLPHLGDVVESVFSVLDCYHGYPGMVESMFSVLGAMIDQAPIRGEEHPHTQPLLRKEDQLTESQVIRNIVAVGQNRPVSPEPEEVDEEIVRKELQKIAGDDEETAITSALQAEKATTKTVERIVRYGQYYLTYDTPQIRQGLLNVLQTGLIALRHDEDALLPVINDIWPVLIARVYDTEPYVSISALQTLSVTIRCAGEFMSSRIEGEWDRLRSFGLRHRPKLGGQKSSSKAVANPSELQFTSGRRIWSAMLQAMASIVTFLRVTAAMEDDLFALLGHQYMSDNDELDQAMRLLNPDTYWLVRQKPELKRPTLAGYDFPSIGTDASQ